MFDFLVDVLDASDLGAEALGGALPAIGEDDFSKGSPHRHARTCSHDMQDLSDDEVHALCTFDEDRGIAQALPMVL